MSEPVKPNAAGALLAHLVRSHGGELVLRPDGSPAVKGTCPPEVLSMLRDNRQAVIDYLGSQERPIDFTRPIEVRFGNGYVCPLWFPEERWEPGVREWRYADRPDDRWREVPPAERAESVERVVALARGRMADPNPKQNHRADGNDSWRVGLFANPDGLVGGGEES